MSLFPTETPVVSLPESTRTIQMMRMQNKRSLETRKQVITMNFRQFWRTRELAIAICTELGTGASEWFTKSYQEQLALKDLDPTWEMLSPPYEVTINED